MIDSHIARQFEQQNYAYPSTSQEEYGFARVDASHAGTEMHLHEHPALQRRHRRRRRGPRIAATDWLGQAAYQLRPVILSLAAVDSPLVPRVERLEKLVGSLESEGLTEREALEQTIAALEKRVSVLEGHLDELRSGTSMGFESSVAGSIPLRGERETKWLAANYAAVSEEYRGTAVAILGDAIVDADPDLVTLVDRCRSSGNGDALFVEIPRRSRRPRI